MMRMPAAKPRTLAAGGRNAATSIPKEDHIRSVGMYPCSLASKAVMGVPKMRAMIPMWSIFSKRCESGYT